MEPGTDLLNEPLAVPGPNVHLYGNGLSAEALSVARANLERANLLDRATFTRSKASTFEPPEGPGLVLINPPRRADGERMRTAGERLGTS